MAPALPGTSTLVAVAGKGANIAGKGASAAGKGVDSVERALSLVPRLVDLVSNAESLVARAGDVMAAVGSTVARIDTVVSEVQASSAHAAGVVARTETVVDDAAALISRLSPMLDQFEPTLTSLHPILATVTETTDSNEVDAVVTMVNLLPTVVDKFHADILPVLDTLGTVAPDVRDLLDVSRELNELLGAIPGVGRVKRRIDEEQAETDTSYRAAEKPPAAPERAQS